MNPTIRNISRELARFEERKRVEHLANAIRELEGLSVARNDALRREALADWTAVLRAIDQNEDPAFDPQDLPETNPAPPPSPSGFLYPSGIPPNAIPDLEVRKKYKEMLAANHAKAERYEFQDQLRRQDRRASEGIERFIHQHYSADPTDRAEITSVVDASNLSVARREKILKMIPRE